MSVLVDTSVWIDFLRGVEARHVAALDSAIQTQRVLIPDIALAEILLGLRSEKIARQVEMDLRLFEIADIGGREFAIMAARNYRALRAKGCTIRSTVDLMIGTWCIVQNIPLLHNDRDYLFMEKHLGLKNALSEQLS